MVIPATQHRPRIASLTGLIEGLVLCIVGVASPRVFFSFLILTSVTRVPFILDKGRRAVGIYNPVCEINPNKVLEGGEHMWL